MSGLKCNNCGNRKGIKMMNVYVLKDSEKAFEDVLYECPKCKVRFTKPTITNFGKKLKRNGILQ